ncbi:MAG: hypothetical protein ACYC4Q_03445 [Victivallaceae bacterium]
MSGKNKNLKRCPSPEAISAFFDGELASGSPEFNHIKSCPECNKILSSYVAIDRALKSMRQEKDAAALASSITEGFYRKLQEPVHKSIPFPKYILRIAAAAAVIGGVIYFSADSLLKNTPQKQNTGFAPQPSLASNAKLKPDHYPYYTGSDSGGVLNDAINENAVPLQNLVNVDYGNSFNPVFKVDDSSNGKPGNPVPISSSVRQVWVVPDLKDSVAAFKTMLERSGIPRKDVTSGGSGNSFKVQSVMTKGQLVNLVKACKGAGFELISPQAPQPEQNTFLGKASDPVFFSVELLQNEPPR